ncbi:hypothetical protein BH11ACT8_BH11ACT8_30900 [soil metagenome]
MTVLYLVFAVVGVWCALSIPVAIVIGRAIARQARRARQRDDFDLVV